MIGTNVNNIGDVSADFEFSVPYLFHSLNGLELKANISGSRTNSFSFRFVFPYVSYFKKFRFIIESSLTNLDHTQTSSYTSRIGSFKTFLLNDNHAITYELSHNSINRCINKYYIPSEKILKLRDQYIKHTIKYCYKNDALSYLDASSNNNKFEEKLTFPFPTSGYHYEIENEVSLPCCEARFFKSHFNFLYAKTLLQNMFSYINISSGFKYDYNSIRKEGGGGGGGGEEEKEENMFTYLNNFNFTGSMGNSSFIMRGFEFNKTGMMDYGFKLNQKEKKFNVKYDYLGGNYFTNIQFLLKYIFKYNNYNPILFTFLQIGKISNHIKPSFKKFKEEINSSIGIGTMTYLQKNIALELFFSYPLLYQMTDGRKYFQVGLNFRANR